MCRLHNYHYICSHTVSHCLSHCRGSSNYLRRSKPTQTQCRGFASLDFWPACKCGVCQGHDLKYSLESRISQVRARILHQLGGSGSMESPNDSANFRRDAGEAQETEDERFGNEKVRNKDGDEVQSNTIHDEDRYDQSKGSISGPAVVKQSLSISLGDGADCLIHEDISDCNDEWDTVSLIDDGTDEDDDFELSQSDLHNSTTNAINAFNIDFDALPSDSRSLTSLYSTLMSAYKQLSWLIDSRYPTRHKSSSRTRLESSRECSRSFSLLRIEVMPEDVVLSDDYLKPYTNEPPTTGGWTIPVDTSYPELDASLDTLSNPVGQERLLGTGNELDEKENQAGIDGYPNIGARLVNHQRRKSMRVELSEFHYGHKGLGLHDQSRQPLTNL